MHTTSIKARLAVLMAAFALLGSLTAAAAPMTGGLPILGDNVAHAGTNDDSI
jgi:hypothetical protein